MSFKNNRLYAAIVQNITDKSEKDSFMNNFADFEIYVKLQLKNRQALRKK